MNHSVRGWRNGWESFGRVLLPLSREFPEVVVLMRYLVGRVSSDDSDRPAKAEPTKLELEVSSVQRSQPIPASTGAQSVLFIPLFSRTYCLGSCLKVVKELREIDPEISVLMLEPAGEIEDVPAHVETFTMPPLRESGLLLLPGALNSGIKFWSAVRRVLNEDKVLCEEMTRVFGNWKSHLLKWCCLYRYDQRVASRFLAKRRVRSVVTINDMVKPAAPFISAGNESNLQTVVIQHGTPGPQSAPFLAREGWMWGETSQRAFESFGADPTRLKIMGGLESEDGRVIENLRKGGPRTLVFLAQWQGSLGWGEPFFREVFDLLREVLERREGSWKLRVRLHPTDPAEATTDILTRLESSRFDVELGKIGISLVDELGDADALLTISSSGSMVGISCGIPTAQIFSTKLEEKIGLALLSAENVLRDHSDLERWLLAIENPDSAGVGSTSQILANRGRVAETMARALAGPKTN